MDNFDDFDYFEDMESNNLQDDNVFEDEDIDLMDFGEDPVIDINNNAKQLDANEPSFFKKAVNFIANAFVFVGAVIGSFVRAVIFGDNFQREMETSARNFSKAGKVKEENKLNNERKQENEYNEEANQEKTIEENINNEININNERKQTNSATENINKVMGKICNENFDIFKELGIDAEIKEDKYFKQDGNNGFEIKNCICVSTFDNLRNPAGKIVLDDNNSLNNIVDNSMFGIMKHQPFVHNDILLSKKGNEFRPLLEQEAYVNAALKTSMLQAAIIVSSRKNMISKSNYGDLMSSVKVGEYTNKNGDLKNSELRVYASTQKNGNNEYENKITFRYKGRDIASINTEDLIGMSNRESGFLLSKVDEISKTMYQMMNKEDRNYIKGYCKEYNINSDDLCDLKRDYVEVVTDKIIQEKLDERNNLANEHETISEDDLVSDNIIPEEYEGEGFINFSELAEAIQNELDEDFQINETKDEQVLMDDENIENIENISFMSDEMLSEEVNEIEEVQQDEQNDDIEL